MTLKQRLRDDLTLAMKDRDELRTATLRMALAAITTAEVAGKRARELTDDDVVGVLRREAKRRREAAEAYDAAQRVELAERERAESRVITEYLPDQLGDEDLQALVAEGIAEAGLEGQVGMGAVMKLLMPKVQGRAEGKRVSDAVKKALTGP